MKKFSQFLVALSAILAFAANANAQEIHIKARFFEMPKETLAAWQKDFNVASDGTRLLTMEQMNKTLQNFESDSSVKELAEPEVTTSSGRQTRMMATQIITVVTNFAFDENSGKTSIFPQAGKMECGPTLDVIPTISDDNQILLKTTAKVTTFLGYADSKNVASHFATNSAGERITLPVVLPQFDVKEASAKIAVPDGQTLVLFPKAEIPTDQRLAKHIAQAEKNGKKFLIALITPTIVDDAGNRIHSDN